MSDAPSNVHQSDEQIQLLEQRVEQLEMQLLHAQKLASIGELSSSITHEFNNILTTVINYAKLGLRHKTEEQRNKAFDKILTASQRAAKITTSLLSFARGREGHRETQSLKSIVDDVLVLVEKDLQVHRISWDVQTDGEPHAKLDAGQIQQVVLNLIVNARQAMQPGGSLTIRVVENSDDGKAELSVQDTGSGIPEDQLPKIFDRFYSTKKADENGQGGTGLGLALCRKVIEAHGGRIRVESAVGHGTRFTLRFPLVPKGDFIATSGFYNSSNEANSEASIEKQAS